MAEQSKKRAAQEVRPHGLATEKDIDPKFGLFTEDEAVKGPLKSAADELTRLRPDEESQ